LFDVALGVLALEESGKVGDEGGVLLGEGRVGLVGSVSWIDEK